MCYCRMTLLKLLVCRHVNIWLPISRCFYWMNGYLFYFLWMDFLSLEISFLLWAFKCLNLIIFKKRVFPILLYIIQVKFVNTNGLLNFNVDLKKCEEFAASRPVTGFAVGTLEMSFEELRQVSFFPQLSL